MKRFVRTSLRVWRIAMKAPMTRACSLNSSKPARTASSSSPRMGFCDGPTQRPTAFFTSARQHIEHARWEELLADFRHQQHAK